MNRVRTVRSCFGLEAHDVPVLRAARLRLGGPARGALAFADRWRRAPRPPARLLCSAELAAIWPPGVALGLPWGDVSHLGRLDVALGPAGSTPEAAVLRARVEARTLVCALAARAPALPGSALADVSGADVLLLDGAGLGGLEPDADPTALAALDALVPTGGAILLDDPRLMPAIADRLAHRVGLRAPQGLAARAQRAVGAHVRPWRGPLKAGEVGVWPSTRGEQRPAAAAWLHLQDPMVRDPVALKTPRWSSVRWSTRPGLAGLEALCRASGAGDVVLWQASARGARRLAEVVPDLQVWRLTHEAQLTMDL